MSSLRKLRPVILATIPMAIGTKTQGAQRGNILIFEIGVPLCLPARRIRQLTEQAGPTRLAWGVFLSLWQDIYSALVGVLSNKFFVSITPVGGDTNRGGY